MRTDVCNVCDYLRVKINNCTGLEKEKVQKILALHQEDANREYERESGLINSIISYSVSDNMQIWVY